MWILSATHPLSLAFERNLSLMIGSPIHVSFLSELTTLLPMRLPDKPLQPDESDDMGYDVYARRSISPRTIPRRPPTREAAFPPPRRPPTAPARVDPNPVLGVFGLSIRTREGDLEDEFARYGDVAKVVIVYDQRVCSSSALDT